LAARQGSIIETFQNLIQHLSICQEKNYVRIFEGGSPSLIPNIPLSQPPADARESEAALGQALRSSRDESGSAKRAFQ